MRFNISGNPAPWVIGRHLGKDMWFVCDRIAFKEELEVAELVMTECGALQPVDMVGTEVSLDVSTGDADHGNRVFGKVTEIMSYDGKNIILAEETHRNF